MGRNWSYPQYLFSASSTDGRLLSTLFIQQKYIKISNYSIENSIFAPMKIKESIYSLLLLVVIAMSAGGVFISALCQCDDNHYAEHHHCGEYIECESHDIALEHPCVVKNESSFEYLVVETQREGAPSLIYLFVDQTTPYTPLCTLQRSIDISVVVDLYRGFDLSTGLLRAPPVSA